MYKTIVLSLIEANKPLHDQLKADRNLLDTVEQRAKQMRESHRSKTTGFMQRNPDMSQDQASAQAMELAVADMEHLLSESAPA